MDHGKVAVTLTKDVEEAEKQYNKLAELGLSIEKNNR